MRERATVAAHLSTQQQAKMALMKSLTNFSSKRLQQEFRVGSAGVFDPVDPISIKDSQVRQRNAQARMHTSHEGTRNRIYKSDYTNPNVGTKTPGFFAQRLKNAGNLLNNNFTTVESGLESTFQIATNYQPATTDMRQVATPNSQQAFMPH